MGEKEASLRNASQVGDVNAVNNLLKEGVAQTADEVNFYFVLSTEGHFCKRRSSSRLKYVK